MSKITLLDENMINLIAAGEVIERPASVLKELLENAIDAGATKITVEIEDGGRKLIRVSDNGEGITAEDMKSAFAPHATSKIAKPDDLHNISTMGFRGEALASIAAVANVSMLSKTAEAIQANRIEIDCGRTGPVKPAAADTGTTVEVRDIFCKLPARRKFLRTANTEMSHISEYFTRIAVAWPQLELTLIHNSRQMHHLPAGQTLTQRIQTLYGTAMAADLMETSADEKNIRLRALIGKPNAARTSASYQHFFLNRRYIRDRFISHAVKEAYRGLTEPGKFPVVFLFLAVDPKTFDVNVHPTKTEVRFDNPNLIHSQVLAALREKLLSTNLTVSAGMPKQNLSPQQPQQADDDRQQRIMQAMGDFFRTSAPPGPQRRFDFHKDPSKPAGIPAQTPPPPVEPQAVQPQRFLQVQNCYLILATENGFEIIDQHALHERIIYEKLQARVAAGPLPSQRLLIPQTLDITPQQARAVEQYKKMLARLGVEIENFGPRTLAIQAFPTLLEKIEPAAFVADLLDILSNKDIQAEPEKLLGRVLETAACRAAVKAGQPLSQQEVAGLLADRLQYPQACRCPHGRPTSIAFSAEQLEKQFKRTGF